MRQKKPCCAIFKKTGTCFLLLLASTCLATGFARQCPAADNMTVEDAVELGLSNNYNIHIFRNTADIARQNRGKGTAGFLPVLDSRGDFRYDASNQDTGAPASFGNEDSRTWASYLNLTWTLFDGFKMFADKRRYDDLAELGTYQSRSNIETTVVAIMTSFYNLVQQEQLLDVARTNRNISRSRLDREEIRRDLGGASSTDILNARVNFNRDQTTLLNQELTVSISRKNLNILLAREPTTPVSVKKEIIIPPFALSADDILARARGHNSSLLAARYDKQAADETVNVARSAFWPRLAFSGSYGYTDRSIFGDDIAPVADRTRRSIDAMAGLMLSFNLFNGNVDRINYQNARLDALNRDLALRNIENELSGLVRETYATYEQRLAIMQLEEQNTVTARQNLDRQKERYATGASTSLDFRDAQVNYAQAQATLISARYQARIALLELHQLMGQIRIE